MMPAAREELAALLLRARREGFQIEELPGQLVPETAEEAYAVQDRVSALLGWPTLGWKIHLRCCSSKVAQPASVATTSSARAGQRQRREVRVLSIGN